MKTSTFIILIFFVGTSIAEAQIIDRVLKRTKERSTTKTEQKTDEAIDKGLDKAEEVIDGIFKKKNKTTQVSQPAPAPAPGIPDNSSNADTDFSQYKGSAFVPGKNVLLFEDFATARLGTGSTNWHLYEYDASDDYERPTVRSITAATGNWLKMPRKGFVFPNGFKNLPEQFTVEFDLFADPVKMSEMEGGFRINFVAKDDREEYGIYWPTEPAIELTVHPHGSTKMVNIAAETEYKAAISGKEKLFDNTFKQEWNPGQVNHVSIYRNGTHVILYLNGKEMLNLPAGLPKKAPYNLIFSTNLWGDGMYVTNIRVAGNVADAAQEIKTAGRLVTNTIYFDTNSSHIRPESWATLNSTAQAIKAQPGKILIVGHTDSDGADDANLKLSQSRAEAVKNALVKEFGIDAEKLTTDGKGESEPVTTNNTTSGKAQNRRVEFIKL